MDGWPAWKTILKSSPEDSSYTQPDEVEEFVSKTGVDSLAIAIGTQPWCLSSLQASLSCGFDILEEVSRRLPEFPIVLHGASSVIPEFVEIINKYGGNMPGAKGVPEELLRKAAEKCGLQNQHRFRPAPCHDCFHPQIYGRKSFALRSAPISLRLRAMPYGIW